MTLSPLLQGPQYPIKTHSSNQYSRTLGLSLASEEFVKLNHYMYLQVNLRNSSHKPGHSSYGPPCSNHPDCWVLCFPSTFLPRDFDHQWPCEWPESHKNGFFFEKRQFWQPVPDHVPSLLDLSNVLNLRMKSTVLNPRYWIYGIESTVLKSTVLNLRYWNL